MLSPLLALCEGNPLVTGVDYLHKGQVLYNFYILFVVSMDQAVE